MNIGPFAYSFRPYAAAAAFGTAFLATSAAMTSTAEKTALAGIAIIAPVMLHIFMKIYGRQESVWGLPLSLAGAVGSGVLATTDSSHTDIVLTVVGTVGVTVMARNAEQNLPPTTRRIATLFVMFFSSAAIFVHGGSWPSMVTLATSALASRWIEKCLPCKRDPSTSEPEEILQ